MTEDTLGAVLDEVAEVFSFVKDDRPQERAHAYLELHQVRRWFNDTAMQCAVADMVRRAYACAMADCQPRAADRADCPPDGPDSGGQPTETVDSPTWYTSGGVETIDKVEAVVDGLPARDAYLLGQVVRYVDRAGMKDEAVTDLGKANNYAHRLVRGKWRDR